MKRFIYLCLITVVCHCAQAQNITRIEYAFDTDPGYGLATPVSFTPESNLAIATTLDFTGLSEGIHILYIRAMDDSSRWGNTIAKPIVVDNILPANVIMAEYFIDTDPGIGNGIAVSIPPSTSLVSTFSIDVSGVSPGMHILYIRLKDEAGQWSLTNSKVFFNEGSTMGDVSQIEYFFDSDPGFGNGVAVYPTPGQQISEIFDISTTSLTGGTHRVYIRSKDVNGTWSQTESQLFTIVDMKVYLEGLYDPGTGAMRKAMDDSGEHFGGTTADMIDIKVTEAASPSTIAGVTTNVLLNQNGTCQPILNRIPEGDYYLAVKHRNSIETWTSAPVNLGTAPVSWDFTDDIGKAYGNNLKEMSGTFVIYGGDVNQDGAADGLDMIALENQAANFGAGYLPEDINGDGSTDALDMIVLDNNAAAFVAAVLP
jgi:hypothetical protein